MERWQDRIERLAAALPPSSDLSRVGSPDVQSRAALAMVVERALAVGAVARPFTQREPNECPNCGAPVSSARSPYCGDVCREQAAFVRQFRGALAEGTVYEEERQVGMGQAAWRVLGGGYTRRTHLLTERGVERVLQRDGGRCAHCGAPATTVEHIGSG